MGSEHQDDLFGLTLENVQAEWNQLAAAHGLRRSTQLNPELRKRFAALRKDPYWVKHWQTAMRKIPEFPALLGANQWLKGGRAFRAHLRWFLNEQTVQNLIEDVYERRPQGQFVGDNMQGRAF